VIKDDKDDKVIEISKEYYSFVIGYRNTNRVQANSTESTSSVFSDYNIWGNIKGSSVTLNLQNKINEDDKITLDKLKDYLKNLKSSGRKFRVEEGNYLTNIPSFEISLLFAQQPKDEKNFLPGKVTVTTVPADYYQNKYELSGYCKYKSNIDVIFQRMVKALEERINTIEQLQRTSKAYKENDFVAMLTT
jgi:hypothetical protein